MQTASRYAYTHAPGMEFALSDHKQAIESCRDGLQSGEWQRRQAIALTGSEEHGQNLRVHDWSPRLDIPPPLPLQALCCGWWDLAELDPGSQSDLRTRLAPAVQHLSPLTGCAGAQRTSRQARWTPARWRPPWWASPALWPCWWPAQPRSSTGRCGVHPSNAFDCRH